jgi:nitrogen fixation protein NifZ
MTTPKYEIGRWVRATGDLLNDGSYPDTPEQAVLVGADSVGEIVKIGTHLETESTVYLVEFGERVIGCLEGELAPA